MTDLPGRKPNPELERDLLHTATATKAVLRERYQQLFKRDPPKAFGPDLLRRCVAQRLQENVYGGLSKAAQRELNRLVRAMIARPDARLKVTRRAQSRTHLVRDWKGKTHRVLIVEEGFSYEGKDYTNLSEIARLITGTRWNGPRFFGLRRTRAEIPDEPKAAPKSSPKAAAAPTLTQSSRSKFKRAAVSHGL
jgi:hypothetical protein